MTGDPLVSIRCLVYNHEPFLRQCLDGFVMQQTTFPFEAIVHDDASTDGSAAIIREYAEKYPDIIKPIYETENQYSKRDGSIIRIIDAAIHPNTKYLAYCEGDDYWTDPHKLQFQVDFLESHPDYVICSHDVIFFNQGVGKFSDNSLYHQLSGEKIEYTLNNYFKGWWTHPLTCVYRRGNYRNEMIAKNYQLIRDDVFYYNVLIHGKGMLFLKVMGVYRIHGGGVWSSLDEENKLRRTRSNAFQIYRIEGDKRAFSIIKPSTISLLGLYKQQGKRKKIINELMDYFRNAPFDEFYSLLSELLGSRMRHFLHNK
jgi:glycosyltransferase involved in cell wall biosynthesis